jgi:endonuclease/exonuclease/phosphatase family metal-dependent hydrolase
MKLVLAYLVFFLSCAAPEMIPLPADQVPDLSLMSLNVHYYVPANDRTDWENRRVAVTASIQDLDPDIILFQEMETFEWQEVPGRNVQLDWVLRGTEGYKVGAFGDPQSFPITQPILFKANKFTQLDQGFFYFSPQPDTIYGLPWEGEGPAYGTWVLLATIGPEPYPIYIFNIHLDAFSGKNRELGSQLIRDRIQARSVPSAPVILGGDFNAFSWDGNMSVVSETGLVRQKLEGASFHFGWGGHLYPAIDHIFLDEEAFELIRGAVIQEKWEGHYPSDHHPVYIELNKLR